MSILERTSFSSKEIGPEGVRRKEWEKEKPLKEQVKGSLEEYGQGLLCKASEELRRVFRLVLKFFLDLYTLDYFSYNLSIHIFRPLYTLNYFLRPA